VAIADMFLKVAGGPPAAPGGAHPPHKGEIEVLSWSWGMQMSVSAIAGSEGTGRSTMSELEIVKKVDQASPTLMSYLRSNKLIGQAKLTVRKAGKTPLEYVTIALKKVRITSLKIESQGTELVERLRLGFGVVTVTYTPQDEKGGPGAASVFEADALTPI
jgi:type VI secretion system secreted protein Hcp